MLGIMGAMPEEIQNITHLLENKKQIQLGDRTYYTGTIYGLPVVAAFSRWGKVAAAATASALVLEFKITRLIFTGVAGAIHKDLKTGDVVLAGRLVQHDMDARPLMPRFEIPLLGKTYFEADPALLHSAGKAIERLLTQQTLSTEIGAEELGAFDIKQPGLFTGLVASGDKFFSGNDEKDLLQKDLPDVLCVEMEGAAVAQVCYEYGIPFGVIRVISDAADGQSHVDFPRFIKKVAGIYSVEIVKSIMEELKAGIA